ncbi:MAG: hypothetical protein E7653_02015 [Ruminococcaceae bacterium]|nr:hypothetical protein [Oscillospiraceae bacterium]
MLRKKETKIDLCFLIACILLAIFLGFGIFFLPKKNFSEQENRMLSSPPELSLGALLDGSFFDTLSSFCSDHIPMRNTMISAKAACELCLGKRQNNGVIFSSNGVLTDRLEYDDTSMLTKNISAIQSFSEKNGAKLIIVPRSVDVRFPELDRSARVSQVCEPTLLGNLRALYQTGTDPYYKTDHHLNASGILALYELLGEELGYTPTNVERQIVSSSFLGSVYSKAGLLNTTKDELVLLRYEGDENVRVRCFDDGCEQSSLYAWDRLNVKDKYTVFLGGNHGLMEISKAGTGKPRVLLIKDSFANALIPILAEHFDITAVDPRYCKDDLSTLAEKGKFDRILVLCGADTLATTNIAKSFAAN